MLTLLATGIEFRIVKIPVKMKKIRRFPIENRLADVKLCVYSFMNFLTSTLSA
jgi:hypothetical protein